MKRAIIISGGSISPDIILENIENRYIVAVDSGAGALYENGIMPDLIVGDLDSLSRECLEYYEKNESEIERVPCEKNETDTELAVQYVLEKGYTDIVILGATGTRLDHTMGNINLLYRLMRAGRNGRIIDCNNEIVCIEKKTKFMRDSRYKYISVLPFGGHVRGLKLNGFKYDAEGLDLEVDSVIGISNEIAEDEAFIDLESGILLVIKSND